MITKSLHLDITSVEKLANTDFESISVDNIQTIQRFINFIDCRKQFGQLLLEMLIQCPVNLKFIKHGLEFYNGMPSTDSKRLCF